jgi:hypothetical protein
MLPNLENALRMYDMSSSYIKPIDLRCHKNKGAILRDIQGRVNACYAGNSRHVEIGYSLPVGCFQTTQRPAI